MIQDVFVVDASAHSYNLREDNYAVGKYSQAVPFVEPTEALNPFATELISRMELPLDE
jgi:hypothetical protein